MSFLVFDVDIGEKRLKEILKNYSKKAEIKTAKIFMNKFFGGRHI